MKQGECKVTELFRIFNLQRLIKWSEPNKIKMKRENTDNKFYGRGFIATNEGSKYYLEYQLTRHGGGSKKNEVSKEVYEDSRKGNKTTAEILKKYNLYNK